MASYIFLTSEGATLQPETESMEPEIENLQVLGFADGNSPDEAYRSLLEEASYLLETAFDVIFCYELANHFERTKGDFSIKETMSHKPSGA